MKHLEVVDLCKMKVCFIDFMPVLVLLLLLVLTATYNYVYRKFGCYCSVATKTLLSDSTFGVFPGLEYNFLPLINMCKPIKEKTPEIHITCTYFERIFSALS